MRIACVVALWVVSMTVAASAGSSVLIEAEDYARRTPDDGSFALDSSDNSASGRRALRVFGRGSVDYDMVVERGGTYHVWLRYASTRDTPIVFAVGEMEGRATLVGGGQATGAKAWRWQRVATAKFKAGSNKLTLNSAPIRVDCLYLTTSDEPVNDEVFLTMRPVDAATAQRLAASAYPITPEWLKGADEYRLPDWYERWRVHAHTRLGPPLLKRADGDPTALFYSAGAKIASIGFPVLSRHIKSGREPAWWPSAVGETLPGMDENNVAKRIIDEAHAAGLRLIAYSRHMEDEAMGKRHPDWGCVGPEGKPLSSNRGQYLCLNSPYLDFVQTRLLELVDYGADGFYFDEVHMPKIGCWCRFCSERFTSETGLEMPKAVDARDPVYQRLIDFKNDTIERAFRQWRAALHGRNAEVVMLISVNSYPWMIERQMSHRLLQIADSVKTEFNLAARPGGNRIFERNDSLAPPENDTRITLGWTMVRDGADGRPPHIWTHGLSDSMHATFATAAMVGHGTIANLDCYEHEIPAPAMFADAVKLGRAASDAMAGTRPLRWAAIHYSESARDQYLPNEAAAWRNVLYPVYGAYTTLIRQRVPVGIVTDSQLEQGKLEGYGVLFVAAPDHLTQAMRSAIEQFRGRGGVVIEQQAGWEWHRPDGGMREAGAAMIATLGAAMDQAPVKVAGGPPSMHAVAFRSGDGRRTVVNVINEWDWVDTGSLPTGRAARAQAVQDRVRPAPPALRDVVVSLRTETKPQRVYDAVSGKELAARFAKGRLTIALPAIEVMASVVVEF